MQFRRPAGSGDQLVVRTAIEELRGAGSTWSQRIVRTGAVAMKSLVDRGFARWA